ncbi:MAG: preprotein translocase subunit SecG [Candidatus Omnitrophica bacterium]|nr:preprotein translocase subunit SecG [Candidatus Omnitrophota bacterium]MDD5238216.1 preprotein translocase subunit SecG [Candidatus Omnitrophota bacterium]
MMTLIIIIHVIACIVLICLVLIQRGRGSGLVESFQGVESMFGTKTNTFLTRTTTVFSVIFFISCLSLAILSVRQSRSLMTNIKSEPQAETAKPAVSEPQAQVTQERPQEEAPKTE